ncbi:unnamed protein product [Rotaria sp. Silwood2]|nr:unnamed protein product [Rotaria sp. Silwood2]CAF2588653.1 unnamed protein product [Rotaria sp. Silwood2]CAF2853320.1 unnamed protein product [Rotaria sp. Silwood2]CAF3000485.1 unnamed protein product [Rotaria sp. Silwood2]CAF4068561.1 unnamed protein product [Rotaria sp. Silwood2]
MSAIRTIEEVENLETFYLIWLGDSMKNEVRQQLRTIINYLLIFEDEQQCLEYIRSLSKDDRVILVIKKKLSQQFIPQIAHFQQITSIYIHSNDKNINEQSMKNLNKVKGAIVRRSELVQRVQTDYNQRQFYNLDEILSINFFRSRKTDEKLLSTNLNADFIYSQMLIDCLICMQSSSNDKNELIALCKQQYKNNPNELSIVEEFEKDYLCERSLWWYTRHSFLYRLMNKAIRMQNINLLLLFRFFIYDIRKQLIKNKSRSSMRVYRAQLMFKEELELLTKFTGEFISINSFLLTTPHYEQTQAFLSSLTSSDNMEKVLFEIIANSQSNDIKYFSNITSYSYFRNKEEVLFMIGSIFRLVRIDHDINDIWNIQLILCSNNDHPLQSFIQEKKNELDIVDRDPLSFGFILEHMGKLDDAEKFYCYILNQLPKDHEDISRCYHALGEVTQRKGDYNSSLIWYNKSLENDMRITKEDDPNIATSYNSIAVVYSKIGDYKLALESYEKALKIWKKTFGENHPDVALCYNNMGIIYQEQKIYSDALEFYHKAWNIRQQYLPVEHPSLGESHACIGNVHYHLGRYDMALEHYSLSLEILEKSLLPHHPDIAMVLRNIGRVYQAKSAFQQALFYMEKAATVYRHLFSATHPDVIQIEKIIRHISAKL